MIYDVIVIGGGASGLTAALCSAEAGQKVIVLEAGDRIGRKIAASGNGRCNMMNSSDLKYYGNPKFADGIFSKCTYDQLLKFWNRMGLQMFQDECGRLYPISRNSSSVLDAIKHNLSIYDIEVKTSTRVLKVRKPQKVFQIYDTDNRQYCAKRIIVACGGMAQPKLGGSDTGYSIMRSFGHSITVLHPSLTQIQTDMRSISGLKGIRVNASVSLQRHEKILKKEEGEVLFTEYGISGICIMQCARDAEYGDKIILDLSESIKENTLEQILRERRKRMHALPVEQFFSGWYVQKLGYAILKQGHIELKNRTIRQLSDEELQALQMVITHYTLTVEGVNGFESAQVTAGGVCCEEIQVDNLESKLVQGLHCTGETLDVDGDCGGYNLMFAFATGLLAGYNRRPDIT